MNQDEQEFIRLKPDISPDYDIDRTRPLRVQKKQKMYPLLLRASQGYAGELVLEANPAAMKTLPNADAMAYALGGLVFAALFSAGLSFFFLDVLLEGWGSESLKQTVSFDYYYCYSCHGDNHNCCRDWLHLRCSKKGVCTSNAVQSQHWHGHPVAGL